MPNGHACCNENESLQYCATVCGAPICKATPKKMSLPRSAAESGNQALSSCFFFCLRRCMARVLHPHKITQTCCPLTAFPMAHLATDCAAQVAATSDACCTPLVPLPDTVSAAAAAASFSAALSKEERLEAMDFDSADCSATGGVPESGAAAAPLPAATCWSWFLFG